LSNVSESFLANQDELDTTKQKFIFIIKISVKELFYKKALFKLVAGERYENVL